MITGEIVDIEELPDKNISIWVCFKNDKGEEIPTYYNGSVLTKNGKKVWPLLCQLTNFLCKTEEEKREWVRRNVEAQIGNLIVEQAKKAANTVLISDLKSIVAGGTYEKDTVDVATTINGSSEKRIVTLKDDGTAIIKESV